MLKRSGMCNSVGTLSTGMLSFEKTIYIVHKYFASTVIEILISYRLVRFKIQNNSPKACQKKRRKQYSNEQGGHVITKPHNYVVITRFRNYA
jgi:hypothetical protein